jgi:hypothetical protein
MVLDDPALPPFEPILRRLYELAQRNGFSVLEKERYTLADFENNQSVRRKFLRACHYGYDLAQRQIAGLVIDMEGEVARLTSELKELRRRRDTAAQSVLQRIQVLKNRQITLRRLVDSILYAMIEQQNWLLRRFTIDLSIHNIDPVVLDRTVRVAVERNSEDRMKFSLVCDLSTVIQIGDLLEIDLTLREGRRWRVIELKQGAMNEILSGLITQQKSEPTAAVSVANQTMGRKAAVQAQRMVRQVRRMQELDRIVATDRGLDPLNDIETLMTPDTLILDNYYNEIEKVYERTRQKATAALEVNGCLRIVGISQDKGKGRAGPMAAHLLFHMANPKRSCAFVGEGDATRQNEEATMLKAVPYFVDIVDYNLRVPIADPIFAWAKSEMGFDLVIGRIRIFVQFDYEAFFRYAEKQNIKINWIKGKEAETLRKMSMRIPGTKDAWGVVAELQSGDRMTLLAGFLARPYANLATPHQMIEMIKDWPTQTAKTDPEKQFESPV